MRRAAAALTVAALAVLATAGPASAHNYLVASTPEAGEVLTDLPERFSVTTNEALLDLGGSGSAFGIEIRDAAGLYYGDGCVEVEGPSMSTEAALGEPGEYTFVYQLVSADGHTVSDSFGFTWAPEGGVEASTGSTSAGDCNGLYERGEAPPEAAEAASIDLGSVLWIGGALGAVVVAVLVTMLVLRPKKQD
jgi:copper resistance protein C